MINIECNLTKTCRIFVTLTDIFCKNIVITTDIFRKNIVIIYLGNQDISSKNYAFV